MSTPSRAPLKRGFLKKKGEINKALKKRFFLLWDNRLEYYKSDKDKKASGVIWLTTSSIVRAENSASQTPASPASPTAGLQGALLGNSDEFGFVVAAVDDGRSRNYAMMAHDAVERAEWIEAIQKVIENARDSGDNGNGAHPGEKKALNPNAPQYNLGEDRLVTTHKQLMDWKTAFTEAATKEAYTSLLAKLGTLVIPATGGIYRTATHTHHNQKKVAKPSVANTKKSGVNSSSNSSGNSSGSSSSSSSSSSSRQPFRSIGKAIGTSSVWKRPQLSSPPTHSYANSTGNLASPPSPSPSSPAAAAATTTSMNSINASVSVSVSVDNNRSSPNTSPSSTPPTTTSDASPHLSPLLLPNSHPHPHPHPHLHLPDQADKAHTESSSMSSEPSVEMMSDGGGGGGGGSDSNSGGKADLSQYQPDWRQAEKDFVRDAMVIGGKTYPGHEHQFNDVVQELYGYLLSKLFTNSSHEEEAQWGEGEEVELTEKRKIFSERLGRAIIGDLDRTVSAGRSYDLILWLFLNSHLGINFAAESRCSYPLSIHAQQMHVMTEATTVYRISDPSEEPEEDGRTEVWGYVTATYMRWYECGVVPQGYEFSMSHSMVAIQQFERSAMEGVDGRPALNDNLLTKVKDLRNNIYRQKERFWPRKAKTKIAWAVEPQPDKPTLPLTFSSVLGHDFITANDQVQTGMYMLKRAAAVMSKIGQAENRGIAEWERLVPQIHVKEQKIFRDPIEGFQSVWAALIRTHEERFSQRQAFVKNLYAQVINPLLADYSHVEKMYRELSNIQADVEKNIITDTLTLAKERGRCLRTVEEYLKLAKRTQPNQPTQGEEGTVGVALGKAVRAAEHFNELYRNLDARRTLYIEEVVPNLLTSFESLERTRMESLKMRFPTYLSLLVQTPTPLLEVHTQALQRMKDLEPDMHIDNWLAEIASSRPRMVLPSYSDLSLPFTAADLADGLVKSKSWRSPRVVSALEEEEREESQLMNDPINDAIKI